MDHTVQLFNIQTKARAPVMEFFFTFLIHTSESSELENIFNKVLHNVSAAHLANTGLYMCIYGNGDLSTHQYCVL